tara:strand:- start:201 stop:302 length:102 start_codon:yes stop_codon:yes gene_type:complete
MIAEGKSVATTLDEQQYQFHGTLDPFIRSRMAE